MITKKNLLLSLAFLMIFILAACDDSSDPQTQSTDYSLAAHWLSLPAVTKPVDIFYLYLTAWTSTDPANPHICDIDEPSMLIKAPFAFEQQATAFETVGNIYAPYYRQDNGSSSNRLKVIAGIPTSDAVAAFDYYIRHFNNNRPFILAGHSQGATVLSNLLSGYMKNHPEVYSRMIAAYVIGHPITDAYLTANPHLKFATGPDDTGVIISWNTEAPVIGGVNPVLYGLIGRVINPLTWTTEETLIDNSYNLGSILLTSNGSVAEDANGNFALMTPSADAQIDKTKGVLICSTVNAAIWSPGPSPQNPSAFPEGVFHDFDIPFYYYNLRANAQNRVNKYLGK
jgi:pimeloyl-ACP methyl ester carboxylesterase